MIDYGQRDRSIQSKGVQMDKKVWFSPKPEDEDMLLRCALSAHMAEGCSAANEVGLRNLIIQIC